MKRRRVHQKSQRRGYIAQGDLTVAPKETPRRSKQALLYDPEHEISWAPSDLSIV
jgi:hypothetical protein